MRPFLKLWTNQNFARMDMLVEDEILLSIDTSIYGSSTRDNEHRQKKYQDQAWLFNKWGPNFIS